MNEINLDKNNYRQHSDTNKKVIKKSIKKLGVGRSIVLDSEGSIIAGNGVYEQARELGIPIEIIETTGDKLFVLKRMDLKTNDKKRKELALIDNHSTDLSEFDYEAIAGDFNIDELTNWEFDESLFKVEMADNEAEGDEDDVPEPPEEQITKLGDLWEIGEHRLFCGDCTVKENVDRLMDSKQADMVLTDPPYNTGMKAKNNNGGRLSHMFNDDFTDSEWQSLLGGFTKQAYSALKKDSVAYIFLDWRRNHELIPHIKKHFTLSNIIVWDKMVHGLGSDYKYTYEVINVCKKGKPDMQTNNGEKDYQDVWHIQRKIGRDDEHATKKPVELLNRCLVHASKQNDIILDLFLGSGTTMVASHKNNRICYGMELDEHYCDVIVNRMHKAFPDLPIKLNGEEYNGNNKIKLTR